MFFNIGGQTGAATVAEASNPVRPGTYADGDWRSGSTSTNVAGTPVDAGRYGNGDWWGGPGFDGTGMADQTPVNRGMMLDGTRMGDPATGATYQPGPRGGGSHTPAPIHTKTGLNPLLTGLMGAQHVSAGAPGITQYGLFSNARGGNPPAHAAPPAHQPRPMPPTTVAPGGTAIAPDKTNLPMPTGAPGTSVPMKGSGVQAPINYKGGLNPFALPVTRAIAPTTQGGSSPAPAPAPPPSFTGTQNRSLNPLASSLNSGLSTGGSRSGSLSGGGGGLVPLFGGGGR